jgi:hypothetical protein
MLLPFSNRARKWEPHANTLRGMQHLADDELLDPYELAPAVGLMVVDAAEVCQLLPREVSNRILKIRKDAWSGGVLARPLLPDGSRICILNPTHNPRRKKMTLMEEIAHVHLDHTPSELRRQVDGLRTRTYNKEQEEEAFGVGAAALLPWRDFFNEVNGGSCIEELAEKYDVSPALVKYRIQITAAFKLYHARQRAK